MRLHDAVRYALYVARQIGDPSDLRGRQSAARFGVIDPVTTAVAKEAREQRTGKSAAVISHFSGMPKGGKNFSLVHESGAPRAARVLLKTAALTLLTRILNYGYAGFTASERDTQKLHGRFAVVSLMEMIMGEHDPDIYGPGPFKDQKGNFVYENTAQRTLAQLIVRLWRLMRLVSRQGNFALVGAVSALLRKFYVGASAQSRQHTPEMRAEKAASLKAGGQAVLDYDAKVDAIKKEYDSVYDSRYKKRMGEEGAPRAEAASRSRAPKTPKLPKPPRERRMGKATRVDNHDDLAESVFHDACVIVSWLPQTPITVIIGDGRVRNKIDTSGRKILTEADAGDEYEGAWASWGAYLLDSVHAKTEALVAVCTSFPNAGDLPWVEWYHNEEGVFGTGVSSAAKVGEKNVTAMESGYTHVIFVVDAQTVPAWESAVEFWKSERGLNCSQSTGVGWVTVLLAPAAGGTIPFSSVLSAVAIGNWDPVMSESESLNGAEVTCGDANDAEGVRQAKKLALRGVRTYTSVLKMRNAVTISATAANLSTLAKCHAFAASTNRASDIFRHDVRNIPIAVIDVRHIEITESNAGDFVSLATTRRVLLVTTDAQHAKVVVASGYTPRVRAARKKPAVEVARTPEQTQSLTIKLNANPTPRGKGPIRTMREGTPSEDAQEQQEQATGSDIHAGVPLRNNPILDLPAARGKNNAAVSARDDRSFRAPQQLDVVNPDDGWDKQIVLEGTPDSAELVLRNRANSNLGGVSNQDKLDDLAKLSDHLDFDGLYESDGIGTEKGPVFGDPVRMFSTIYKASETGCDHDRTQCIPKGALTSLLKPMNPKVAFLLVAPTGEQRSGVPHHAEQASKGNIVYLRCASNGKVDAERAMRSLKGRLVIDTPKGPKGVKSAIEGADTIYVLCTVT